jgi:hypothetical protein
MELTVIAYKLEDGLWAFDHPHNNTVQELLMNGTEEAIDEHFYLDMGRHAVTNDKIEIILNTEQPVDYDTLLVKEISDDEGTTYTDTTLCIPVWLCPWLQGYFGSIPEELYVNVRPINNGLEGFINRTGMRQLRN